MNDAFTEWREKDKMNDQRARAMMALLANCHRGKDTPSFKESDFLVYRDGEPDPELEFEIVGAKLMAMNNRE